MNFGEFSELWKLVFKHGKNMSMSNWYYFCVDQNINIKLNNIKSITEKYDRNFEWKEEYKSLSESEEFKKIKTIGLTLEEDYNKHPDDEFVKLRLHQYNIIIDIVEKSNKVGTLSNLLDIAYNSGRLRYYFEVGDALFDKYKEIKEFYIKNAISKMEIYIKYDDVLQLKINRELIEKLRCIKLQMVKYSPGVNYVPEIFDYRQQFFFL